MKYAKQFVLLMLIVTILCGCGATIGETSQSETQTESAALDADTSRLKGTISEIKDFMFVVTDKDGNAYSFSFETKPEGLEDLTDGDKVILDYKGTLSQVDPFAGEIVSIRKAY